MLRWLLILLTFSLAGAVSSLPFVLRADNVMDTAAQLIPAAATAAAVCGTLFWRAFSPETSARWRAPAAGAVAGLVAHPIMWLLITIQTGSSVGISAEQMVAGGILATMFFSLFSMVIYGPVTMLTGALTGWFLNRFLLNTRFTGAVTPPLVGHKLP